jgi:hypothetical protein
MFTGRWPLEMGATWAKALGPPGGFAANDLYALLRLSQPDGCPRPYAAPDSFRHRFQSRELKGISPEAWDEWPGARGNLNSIGFEGLRYIRNEGDGSEEL